MNDPVDKALEKAKKVEEKAEDGVDVMEGALDDALHGVEEVIVGVEKKFLSMAREFFRLNAAGGICLVIAAMIALVIANTPLYDTYHYLLEQVQFRIGFSDLDMSFDAELRKSLLHWVNDGLMAVFFFLVGLEIKREFLAGELASREHVILPAMAAVGGMVVPAAIFWFLNKDTAAHLDGWAIPAATDIAFALGVLSLLGSRVPLSLKVLLTAIAIIDDIGAILIIAVFYSGSIFVAPLYLGCAALVGLLILNMRHVTAIFPYILLTFILWVAVLESGIHATLAGVVAALFIPLKGQANPDYSPLKHLEHALHPWVAFLVLPLFAFANAGVPFAGLSFEDLMNPVTLGIVLGLFVGKQVGIFSCIWLAVVSGLSPKPRDASWLQLYAVSILCGIGFTMSLFIGTLAYSGYEMQASVRLGVLVGSVVSAAAGYFILRYAAKPQNAKISSTNND